MRVSCLVCPVCLVIQPVIPPPLSRPALTSTLNPSLITLPDFVVSSMAAWAHYVFLGERDGTLVQWDTVSGRCQSYLLGRGRAVVSLVVGAAPSTRIYPDGDAGALGKKVGKELGA